MKKRRGFTLIELLVVIAIIAILSAVIAPNAYRAIEKAKVAAMIADYQAVKTGAMSYYSDTGTWPDDGIGEPGLGVTNTFLVDGSPPIPMWDGPYLERWPSPRWATGNPVLDTVVFRDFALFNWDGVGGSDQARYLQVYPVPTPAVSRIDLQLDGSEDANSGDVRIWIPGEQNAVVLLISTDVEVN
jgi:general secretion pathway protein G